MCRGLEQRAKQPELMDDFSQGGPELSEAFAHLRRLNRIFGAAAPTLYGVQRLWGEAEKPRHLSVMDIGAGSGEVNRELLRWADRQDIDLTITLVDRTEEACEEARRIFHHERRVQVMRCDLFMLPEACADIITGTQFIHHFASHELCGVVANMLRRSRLGVVINDIHRHWIAWSAVWLAVRMISTNRYIRHDGPLSVAKGFRLADWQQLRDELGGPEMSVAWRPLFRYAAVIRNNRVNINQRSGLV
ncbi:methyltransferase domain-containing protein [Paenibacillus abyssi]|uniref:Methyltransferase domain-containing protein n=1 Tax=Paenibacillus abyssi TaxID=1340531 RepID=A0A917FXU4_9BACL|nr:methyltransferase domain-containing protein [Paenibacillus abyssi]GGG13521.1 hypothetical protein GCM10010916_33030 [Paenibacillus abyssi]